MIQQLYSIFDSKAKTWSPPFAGHNDEDAKLAFAVMCQDEEHPIGRHCGDYTLYHVGMWDSITGSVAECNPNNLGNGIYFARRQEPPQIVTGEVAADG